MLAEIKPLLDWVHQHPHEAGLAAFAISFLESLAVIGLLFPGIAIMTTLGTLIGAGILSFTEITLWTVTGAICGDLVSFWLGNHFHEHMREFWPFRSHPSLLQKGESFFLRHGGKGVFFGRFIGPMRPLLPLIAGMMSMPPLRFLFADVFSTIIWAPVYMLPGILIGLASQELPPEAATRLMLFVVLFLLVIWCISWLFKKIYLGIRVSIIHLLSHSWRAILKNPRLNFLKSLLTDTTQPQHHRQLGLAVLFIVSFTAFIVLVFNVIYQGPLLDWNPPLYHLMRSLRTTFFDHIMVVVTSVSPYVLLVMWAAVLVWFVIKRYWRTACHWFAIAALCVLSRVIIKPFVHFPRPPGLVQSPASWSFPSGHTLFAVALFGFLAVLLAGNRRHFTRRCAYSIAAVLAGCELFSRVYLGAHWLTDVVGSTLLALSLIAIVTISYRRKPCPVIPPLGVLLVAVVSLTASLCWYLHNNYEKDLRNYTPAWSIQTLDSNQWWAQTNNGEALYRINRFGRPIEVLNVQWAGLLPDIELALQQRSWNLLPKTSFILVLGELAGKQHNQQLPILSQLYEDRKPVLVMYKVVRQRQGVIILRLWDAHIMLSNGKPLWLGTVTYHRPWHPKFLKMSAESEAIAAGLPAAIDVLSMDLKDVQWKKLPHINNEGNILLVR